MTSSHSKDGIRQYQIQWIGYPEPTWEAERDIDPKMVERFNSAAAHRPWDKYTRYVTKGDETLARIAQTHGLDLNRLVELNGKGSGEDWSNNDSLGGESQFLIGTELCVPVPTGEKKKKKKRKKDKKSKKSSSEKKKKTEEQPGDANGASGASLSLNTKASGDTDDEDNYNTDDYM